MKRTVLIVDDVSDNVEILERALRREHTIRTAASGEEALAKVIEEPLPDLVLLDIMMPEMDGYEVCKRLKSEEGTRRIPVIFVTAMGEVEDETRGLELGAVDYIKKPFSLPIVRARVNTHLELKRNIDLLERLAMFDGLTGIPNRRRFDETMEREWRRARRHEDWLSVVLLDVDHFKGYNDHYGHSAGDRCLQKVARALESATARASDMVARYGGEEFVAILPGTDATGAEHVADEMRQAVHSLKVPHAMSSVTNKVTISAGVASVKPSADSAPGQLVKAADEALYRAKEEGRNRVGVARR